MRLRRDRGAHAHLHRGPRRSATALAAIGLMLGGSGLLLALSAPASAAPVTPPSFPTTTDDCRGGGWDDFTAVDFSNQTRCIAWVTRVIVREDCLLGALADFQVTGPTYAAQLGIPLAKFLRAVCHGQDFPVSNASYVVNDPAGTDLLSLASGHTEPFVTRRGHIYWIQVQGAWADGRVRQADARFISDDGWLTRADGPPARRQNLETQINGRFVAWGAYNTSHHYSYWIIGDGRPISMRVFDGYPATNTPNPAWYADNVGPVGGVGMPAIVFEYALPSP